MPLAPKPNLKQYSHDRSARWSCFSTLVTVLLCVVLHGCEFGEVDVISIPSCSEAITVSDVDAIFKQTVAQAQHRGQAVTIAVTDREGNNLGVFAMTGSSGSSGVSLNRAVTAAYLSSNQHGFTSVTACYIVQNHFPPGISNTGGGPLFGVPFSSLPGGDIQPNPGPLDGFPGGVPVFKNGCLVGAIGVSGGASSFQLELCFGDDENEIIALGGTIDFAVSRDERGDNIFLDGVRLKYANAKTPARQTPVADLAPLGTFLVSVPAVLPAPRFPSEGEVLLGGAFDFPIIAGTLLSQAEVQRIIDQAVVQANKTRAAIRRPLGSAARAFITVVDTNGTVLGIWRTPDATLFSYDVSAQKARTAVAFSRPDRPLGARIRAILGVSASAPLAMTTRAVGFLAQDFFPPGIDTEIVDTPVQAGPLFEGPSFKFQENLGLRPFGNGITIFPGGIPLYRDGELVGAIGVSGDGVDQDDLMAFAGAAGFLPPENVRCDQFFFDDIRLPFIKIPRRPELGD